MLKLVSYFLIPASVAQRSISVLVDVAEDLPTGLEADPITLDADSLRLLASVLLEVRVL